MQKVVQGPRGEASNGNLRCIKKSAMPQIVERQAGWKLQMLKPAAHLVAERPEEGGHLDNDTGSGCEGSSWGKK